MNGKIYKITNLINGKVYIGKTIKTLEERFKKHSWGDKNGNHFHMPIKMAIKKYGKENFEISLIEECDEELLNEREIFWIAKYDSFRSKSGYNCSAGGDGFLQNKLSKDEELEVVKLNKIGWTSTKIASKFNIDKSSVLNISKRNGHEFIIWRNLESRIDINKFIFDFNSGIPTIEMSRIYNISKCSVYNLAKRLNIEYNISKSVHPLS